MARSGGAIFGQFNKELAFSFGHPTQHLLEPTNQRLVVH
jgi:hypothetical protein